LIEKSFVALGISQSDTRMSAAAGRGTHKPPASKPPPHRNSAKPGKSSTSPAKSAKPATAAATTATTTTATTTTTTDSISKSSSSSSALSSSSSSSSTTLAHRSACVAVFDANFTAVNVERGLPMFGDGTSFLVVGVVGRVGVGKSTLASLLLGNDTVFPVRSMHDQLAARHCTVGVDVAVSSDRVILLDMQRFSAPLSPTPRRSSRVCSLGCSPFVTSLSLSRDRPALVLTRRLCRLPLRSMCRHLSQSQPKRRTRQQPPLQAVTARLLTTPIGARLVARSNRCRLAPATPAALGRRCALH
jgi:hypothetical protein